MSQKILFLTWSGHIGGAETALARLAGSLDRSKFKAEIWQLNPGPLADILRKEKLEVREWNLKRMRHAFFNFSFHFQLAKHIRENDIKIIHANGTLAYLSGYFATRFCRVPIIWWLVDLPEGKDWNERLAARLQADMVICNSNATLTAFRSRYHRNSSPCEVVYPSFDFPEIIPAQGDNAKSEKLGVKGNPPVVLWAGRFQHWKGPEILVRSIPEVLKQFPDTLFIFAGSQLPGMEDDSLMNSKKLVRELGVEANVRFLGFRQDVHELMSMSDLVVHTSLKPEPFGLVIAEAMALGKAVIAADQGGPREIMDHGASGWLIPSSSPEILADAICHLLANPGIRQDLGKRAKLKAAGFGLKAIAQRMEEIYSRWTRKKE